MSDVQESILQFFNSDHLPPRLQKVVKPFCDMANNIVATLPRNPERTVALRKLLESKDAAVRAHLFVASIEVGAKSLVDKTEVLTKRIIELETLVKRTADAGFSMEDAFDTSHRERHNYQEWDSEQWDRIDAVRRELCACIDAIKDDE